MACKVGCFTRLWRDLELEDALKHAAKAGYKYVGVLGGKGVPSPETTDAEVRDLKQMIADSGLQFVTTWAHMPDDGNVDPFKRHLDIIAELGGVGQLMGGPWPYAKFPDELFPEDVLKEKFDTYFDAISRVVGYAAERNLEIMLKPHTGVSATSKECLESVTRIDHPSFRIWHDPANIKFYEGITPEEDNIAQVAEYVTGICIKDHVGGRAEANFPTPGDGDVNWTGVMATLKAAGFDGACMVEIISGGPEDADVEAVRAREFMERTLAAVGLEVD